MTESRRTIKRYANRKLYDTEDSRYVTLDQISEMIRGGEDVQVIDNSTKDDLTSVTLAQIIFEEEKRRHSFLPLSALKKVIQGGGESLHEFVNQIQESAERVGRVFRHDEKMSEDGESIDGEALGSQDDVSQPAKADATEGEDVAEGEAKADESGKKTETLEPIRKIREFIDSVQSTVDDWQHRVDANVQSALESVSPLAPLQKEISGLRERIAGLEEKLQDLDGIEASEGDLSATP
ncbi:MAG: polyhydroxyalkanoate synthesis regulator DNA-binding domain-containing protein [Deltaproteobacteria bacterium]|nr:polyhydroxyalkanoate synthesis regulator DNA-binding domain-containing protein [Deltaproteobacteria bacterium]